MMIHEVTPMKSATMRKCALFVAVVAFSILVWFQQYQARQAHDIRIKNLNSQLTAMTDRIRKLPTAKDVVGELVRMFPKTFREENL